MARGGLTRPKRGDRGAEKQAFRRNSEALASISRGEEHQLTVGVRLEWEDKMVLGITA